MPCQASSGVRPPRFWCGRISLYQKKIRFRVCCSVSALADGIEVSVINPKAIKRFADASMQRGKTDALDAERILEFLLRMEFRPWQPPSEEVLELQHITRRIVQLKKELTRENNRHIAAKRLGVMGRVVANDIDNTYLTKPASSAGFFTSAFTP